MAFSLTSLHPIYATLDYKSNFVKLENLVLIGGPDDGVITPWQSRYVHFVGIYFRDLFHKTLTSCSHFGFYDENLNVQPYQNQQVSGQSIFPPGYNLI